MVFDKDILDSKIISLNVLEELKDVSEPEKKSGGHRHWETRSSNRKAEIFDFWLGWCAQSSLKWNA